MSKFRPQLPADWQHPAARGVASNSEQNEKQQIAELRLRSGMDYQEPIEQEAFPVDKPHYQEAKIASDIFPLSPPERRTNWLLIATAIAAFFSLGGIAFLGAQLYEMNQVLRQIKEASASAAKSALEAETAARMAESVIKNYAISHDSGMDSSKPTPSKIVNKKSRARK